MGQPKDLKARAEPITGPATFWIEQDGLDGFAEALLSHRLANSALAELVRTVAQQAESDQSFGVRIRRAVATTTSLAVPADEEIALVNRIGQIYAAFTREILRLHRESGSKGRLVHFDKESATHVGDGRWEVTVTASYHAAAKVEESVMVDFLRGPLTDALAPWCTEGVEASAAASELGLHLSLTPHPQEMQRHALLVSGVSSFEAFLSLVIEQICEVDTNVLRSSKLSFTSPDVLDAVKYSELVGRIKADVVQTKARSFLTAHTFLLSVLGEVISVDSAREIVEARNVLVHHAGRVSQQYLDALSPRSYELGDRLVVTTNYVLESLAKLDKVAQNIVMECRRKYAGAAS
jgi:hypothetical protein